MAKAPALAKLFAGRRQIAAKDTWDDDFLDLVERARHDLVFVRERH
jgi:hypothetical protein